MPGRAYFWAELKSDDFRALDPETTIAILPVAATEQHGPHLPVMTDTAIAEGMIGLLQERLPPELNVLVLPIQAIGKSNEHLLSPGTLSLSAETLQHQIADRDHHAREQHVRRQAADHHDRQRLLHLRARPNSQRQGKQAEDRRQAGHQDRAEARAPGLKQRWPQWNAFMPKLLNVFD